MAEPAGIFIEVDMEEKNVKKLLNHKFDGAEFGKKIGYYFSQLLYELNNDPNKVFIFNYDTKSDKCFIAWVHNYFDATLLKTFQDILQIISLFKKPTPNNYALVATIFPDVLEAYQINFEEVKKINNKKVPPETVEKLLNKFWSFSENNDFPTPLKALNKRNYFYKNFKNYYKKYLVYMNEIEKPDKISQATKELPYHLFGNFYTYNSKVFDFYSKNQVIALPEADPLSLRQVDGVGLILADKNYVFMKRLAPNSPPEFYKNGNNSFLPTLKAIYEYYIVKGIDGASFNYTKNKWENVYWKDKDSVFIHLEVQRQLKKIEQADSDSFEYLDFCFGKDKNHVFYKDNVIPINPIHFTINKHGFIFDDEHIFHYQNKIPLDAKTFKVLKYENDTNPFIGTFVLEDKNGKYEYNEKWENEKIKPLTA